MGPSYRGYVYLLGSSRFGWYKIGKSRTARVRVKTLGILLPFKIEVFAIWQSQDHHALETAMHKKYAESHLNGEWFCFEASQIEEIIRDQTPTPSEQIFSIIETDVSFCEASNLSEDMISKDRTIVKRLRKSENNALSVAYLKAVHAYLEENGMEKTKENRRSAKRIVWARFIKEKEENQKQVAAKIKAML